MAATWITAPGRLIDGLIQPRANPATARMNNAPAQIRSVVRTFESSTRPAPAGDETSEDIEEFTI